MDRCSMMYMLLVKEGRKSMLQIGTKALDFTLPEQDDEYFICSADGSGEEAEKRRMDETRKFVGNIYRKKIQT